MGTPDRKQQSAQYLAPVSEQSKGDSDDKGKGKKNGGTTGRVPSRNGQHESQ